MDITFFSTGQIAGGEQYTEHEDKLASKAFSENDWYYGEALESSYIKGVPVVA